MATASDTIHRAYRIAVRDLRACYNPDGIVAGRLRYNAYWARDGFWALFGALALGDSDQARVHLDLFTRYQTPSGKLPVRVEFIGRALAGYHTHRRRFKVLYRAGTIFADPLDPAALFVIAAREYLDRTHDTVFAQEFEQAMVKATNWLMRHDRDGDGLIESHYLADWMDSILKKGKVFCVNVLHYEGLRACASIMALMGTHARAAEFHVAADRLRDRLQSDFWTGDYFTDWLDGRRRGGFSSDGNVLAMLFGVATEAQARRILRYIVNRGLDTTTPLRTCDPLYTWRQVFPFYYLAGIPDYHRSLIWPWLGILNAINKHVLGDTQGARADLVRIGAWFVAGNAAGEVYLPEGTLVARRIYQAEVPFAWSAGLYVYAVHRLGLAPVVSGDAAGVRGKTT